MISLVSILIVFMLLLMAYVKETMHIEAEERIAQLLLLPYLKD